ncbi:MAG: response regulator [Fuerstiella sp.]
MTKVLIVDDNPVDRKLAGAFVAEMGMVASFACDGVEALAVLDHEGPDIVLTDLQMPEMDGLQLVAALKSRNPFLPVVLMTAKGSEEVATKALIAGASSYVPKRSFRSSLQSALEAVDASSKARRQTEQAFEYMTSRETEFRFGNDHRAPGAVVSYFQEALRQQNICENGELVRVGTALTEALVNAIDHGNLELSSELREEDHQKYRQEGERRARLLPYRERTVSVHSSLSTAEAVFTIRDEGPGFDPSTLPDPTDPENLMRPHGRGLMLIRMFMDEVTFNESGNEITMHKYAAVPTD